jgi:iron complex outermembrane recepter protein
MKSCSLSSFFRPALLVAFGWFCLTSLPAQSARTGVIEGKVFDAGRGEFLENARITLEGTAQETFTEAGGQYRFTNVPAGPVRLKVFFTGLVTQTLPVTVTAGQTVQQDVTMAAPVVPGKARAPGDDAVKLSEFVVSTSKDMDGAAIAINEQRFARSIMNVVAADEFGTIVDGTPGEVLKFLPGITLEYSAGEARTVSMNGVPASNVPITVGGFDLASAASNGTSRVTNLDQFSVNSISRIEVRHAPTPETSGSALAGSVNMVPRSAFERSRPSHTASVFLTLKDGDRHFNKTGGPLNEPTRKVTPGFNFSSIVPVNKRFGFTISGNHVDQYSYEDVAASTWRGNGFATTVAANATTGLPDTTPDKPYLTDFAVRDSTRGNRGDSAGLTMDYKLSPFDTVSLSFQYTWIGVVHNNRTLSFFVNRVAPGAWGPTFTTGTPGTTGTAGGFPNPGGFGEIRINGAAQTWYGTTVTPTFVWRHNGPIWKMDAGAGWSRASLHTRNVDKGFFGASQARRTGVQVSFSDIFYLRPNTITVRDGLGRDVDPYNLSNYALDTSNNIVRDSYDIRRSINGSLRRDLSVRDLPVSLKVGAELKSSERDLRAPTETFTFVGKDRVNSFATGAPVNGDDNAGLVLDEAFSQRVGSYGFPKIQWISNDDYYAIYKEHPEYFTTNANTSYQSAINSSKRAQEVISAAYFRGDIAFFNNRLQLVGGLRGEQTDVWGEGPLTDPTGNYLRDAAGEVVYRRDAAGNIIRNTAGVPQPVLIVPTTDALGVSKLTRIDRGQHTRKQYLRLFPNLNVSYNVRDNLIARFAYYQSVGRPDFGQYANGLTLPDTAALPSTSNVINVNNPTIKAWSAETYKVRVEYYYEGVGTINLGAYRREFENFFASTRFLATPEFLALYSLDPDVYGDYDVTTNHNLDEKVRMTGLEFDYKRSLTFLPSWARGVQVFANASAQRAPDGISRNFSFIRRSGSWGFSVTRPKFVYRMNWNYREPQRRGIIAVGRSIEENTYNWGSKRLYLDVTLDYHLSRRFTLFGSMRNINDQTEDSKIYGPHTPDYAKFRQRVDYGSAWTFGLRGQL